MARSIKKSDVDGVYWTQDPAANLDYQVNWTSALVEVSTVIASSIWSISPSGPTLHTQTFLTYNQVTWVSGIVDGTTYTLAGKIVGSNNYKNRKIFRIIGKQGG